MESSASCSFPAAAAAAAAVQNVIVMRHGDRIDASEPLWVLQAERPWDPPLTDGGKIRARATGKTLRAIGFPIHRVVVSPFLRCVQTAREVVAALCSAIDDRSLPIAMENIHESPDIDPSRVKVHIEPGLCEALCSEAMGIGEPAKGNSWVHDISELKAIIQYGTFDHSVEHIYQQLPQWEEPINDARKRYEIIIMALANKFPCENLLLVTHGEAVGVSVSAFAKGLEVYDVEYCALSFLQREISLDDSQAANAGGFRLLTENAKSGVCYYSEAELAKGDTIPSS